MQLLRRTDDALQEKVRQLDALRRQAIQERDQELQDVATALVHRIGGATGDIPIHLARVRAAVLNEGEEQIAVRSEVFDALEHVEKRIQHVQDLLPSLEEIANLAAVSFRPVELSGLVEEVVNDLLFSPGAVDADLAVDKDVIVEGSRNLLRDALRSLLENGYEAMPRGGTLTVRVTKLPGGRAQIRIQDTGVGIADKHKSKMFQLGFSTKGGRRRNRGRGMFTCRAIVRKHGGEISIDSREGHGTVVTIVLPLLGV
jgi:signal transduction histidine kinase